MVGEAVSKRTRTIGAARLIWRSLLCLVGVAGAAAALGTGAFAADFPAARTVGNPLLRLAQYNGGSWAPGSNGMIPAGAFDAGREPTGENIYVCRARYNNSIQLGKVSPRIGACDIPYGGQEIRMPQYEVLVGGPYGWAPVSPGQIPPRAVQGGNDVPPQSPPLFVCEAYYNGEINPGKTRLDWNVCHIGWGGTEYTVSNYSVLIQ
jgi:hypothetical protein